MKDDRIFVTCYPNSKVPIGDDWGEKLLTADEVRQRRLNNPALNVGMVFGSISGLIDVECDSDEAAKTFDEWFPDARTPWWQSTRGRHSIFCYDPRLAPLPGVVKIRGLEFRIGNGKAIQSICPPSVVDGVQRTWGLTPEECPVAALPEFIIEELLKQPPAKPRKPVGSDIPVAKNRSVKRLLDYCKRVGMTVKGVREDHHGVVYIDVPCPLKHENEKGDPAWIVNPDGKFGFHCFHAKCATKKAADVFALLGPLKTLITVGTDLPQNMDEAIAALRTHDNTYQRGGVLVGVTHDAPNPPLCVYNNGGPSIRLITAPTLTVTLSDCADFRKWNATKEDYVSCLPTPAIVNGVLGSLAFPRVPPIAGIASCPILRTDGTVAATPGYDPSTGMWLDIDGTFPPLMEPTQAIATLTDILVDFPFLSSAHRSGWFAALITLLTRAAFSGPSPLFLFDGNMSRVGKGLLTDLLTLIVEGRFAARYAMPKCGDELRKLLTSIAISGVPYLLFDNIKGKFGGAVLENAITSGRWADRLLGMNRQVDLPLNLVWLGTSNNATVSKDMIGRTCQIRLETKLEHPELRNDFTIPDILAHVKERRRELAIAALSIPAAYVAAGRPDMNLSAWGGLGEWSKLVRNSLVWAGLDDPDTRENLAAQADDDTATLEQLMDAWAELGGVATVGVAIAKSDAGKAPVLTDLLTQLSGNRNDALGKLLREFRGRVLGGRKLDRTEKKKPEWKLLSV